MVKILIQYTLRNANGSNIGTVCPTHATGIARYHWGLKEKKKKKKVKAAQGTDMGPTNN